ncbi:S9 family peptidase [Salinicoccus albus]|uniref:S9 family peptidase n=1 Tax=Salinicoccus albus TaxID=418756 RepID=UPI00037541CA|nr:S9 family peptidase [Salinicoccus albus]
MTGNKVEINDIYQIRSVASPKIVPKSNTVTYLVTELDEEKNNYSTNLYKNEAGSSTRLTYKHERISNVVHSPDGGVTLFIGTSEDDKQQVFLLNTDGGEREQLTEEADGVNSAFFSEDGETVFYHVSSEPEGDGKENNEGEKDKKPEPVIIDRMKYKADSTGVHKEKYQSVKTIGLITRESRTLLAGDENYELVETFGDTLVYTSDRSEHPDFNFNQRLFIKSGKEAAKEIDFGEGTVMDAEVSPDGTKLLLTTMGREFRNATHAVISVYDIGDSDLRDLTGHLDKPVGDFAATDAQQSVETTPAKWISNEDFVFVLSDSGSVNLHKGNTNGKISPLYEGRQHVTGMDATESCVAFTLSAPTSPGELYKYEFESENIEVLTSHNAEYVNRTELIEPEAIQYRSEDGTKIDGWFMKPYGFTDNEKYPMITNIHGGPHAFYANTFFHEMQVLAARGCAVLYVNPRGSHSYSQAFVDAVRGDYGNGDYKDIMAGVDYITDKYPWIDQENLGVTGGSYGGFMTNWIVGHTDRFKAAVTQRSISNWISFRGVSDIGYYFTDWQIQADLDDVEKLWHHSPLKYVDEMNTPLLIIHSERDFRCPMEQAEQLYIALKYQQKDTRFIRYPEASHNLSRTGRPNLRVERLHHITDWFARYLD